MTDTHLDLLAARSALLALLPDGVDPRILSEGEQAVRGLADALERAASWVDDDTLDRVHAVLTAIGRA